MSTHTLEGVRCGNRAQHGEDVVYHVDPAAVRDCYAESGRFMKTQVGNGRQSGKSAAAEIEAARLADEERRRARYAAWRSIPVYSRNCGYYAVQGRNQIRFFRVERPATGKYAGRTFVTMQTSDDFHKVPREMASYALDAIAADPAAASALYSAEIERCSRCNKTLTDVVSRERGIGPDCLKKYGGA